MTVRAGMANPLLKLRNLCQVGTADYSVGTVSYWTDQQLQDLLDEYRDDLYWLGLDAQRTVGSGGTALTLDYYFPAGDYEEGTAQFKVQNVAGAAIAPDSIEYTRGHLQFTADQKGSAYYLTARRFDLNAAAARVWKAKAANVAAYYDFSADGQSMSRSQLQKQYLEMARQLGAQARPLTVRLMRSDDA